MLRSAVTIVALVCGVTLSLAQSDPIAARKNLMKHLGDLGDEVVRMDKGQAPFDLAKAQAYLKASVEASETGAKLFPDTSKSGGDTRVAPKVWETPDDFAAKWASFGKLARDAQANVKDEASFKASFATVDRACVDCHRAYRLRRQ
jgi:cytochrome c556